MGFLELFLLALGLSMDAFAVSICKGLNMREINYKEAVITAFFFGLFQAGMPLIGYFLGVKAEVYIESIDHWLIFIILGFIGLKMIRDALSDEEENDCGCEVGNGDRRNGFDFKGLIILAVATSIDALAAGITFAFMEINVSETIIFIGVLTFILSLAGVKIGNRFGAKYQTKAEVFGGIVLILIGTKKLLEDLGILG